VSAATLVPVLASVSDSLVQLAINVIHDLGLPGVFLLMAIESACIPLPSEGTMLFAGFNVSDGHFTLLGVVLAGVLGNLAGSWLTYAIGYYGRVDLIEKHGRRLLINQHHLDVADRWFERHGVLTVFFGRWLPGVRTFVSLPAGVAKMPFWRFTFLTIGGCIPWVLGLALIGKAAGDRWENWRRHLAYLDYAVVAVVVVAVAYLLVRWYRRRRLAATADVTSV
jgi:membrane protein DedA with SNARE-associated domain